MGVAPAAGVVAAVSRSAVHGFRKDVVEEIRILAGLGVEGDAHAGETVRHRFHVRKDPTAKNLCQVHLLGEELFAELGRMGIAVQAGEMGENVTVRGIDLLRLPAGARVRLGEEAEVEVSGLREPCRLMNGFRPGLMKACLGRDAEGRVVRKAGVMAVAVRSGVVRAGTRSGWSFRRGNGGGWGRFDPFWSGWGTRLNGVRRLR